MWGLRGDETFSFMTTFQKGIDFFNNYVKNATLEGYKYDNGKGGFDTSLFFSSTVYHESQPASSGIDQLKKILHLTGTPDSSLVQKMQSKDVRCVCMDTSYS